MIEKIINEKRPEMVFGQGILKRNIRVGIFALLGLVTLIVGVFVIGGKENLFNKTINLKTTFESVQGLKGGAAIVLSGIQVGTVRNVILFMRNDTPNVRVEMVIKDKYKEFIRTSTYASIGQQGLVGDKILELVSGDPSAKEVKEGDSILSIPPVNYMAIVDEARGVVKNASGVTASLDTLFMKFRRGEGTLGKFLTNDSAYRSFVNVSASAENLMKNTSTQFATLTDNLNKTTNSITTNLNNTVKGVENITNNVEGITSETKKIVTDIGSAKGTLGALLYDRSLYDSLEILSGSVNQAVSSAGFAAREIGTDLKGLRGHWLLGSIFGGTPEDNNDLQKKEIEIKMNELKRELFLLEELDKKFKK